jgi:hypothetical protein
MLHWISPAKACGVLNIASVAAKAIPDKHENARMSKLQLLLVYYGFVISAYQLHSLTADHWCSACAQ